MAEGKVKGGYDRVCVFARLVLSRSRFTIPSTRGAVRAPLVDVAVGLCCDHRFRILRTSAPSLAERVNLYAEHDKEALKAVTLDPGRYGNANASRHRLRRRVHIGCASGSYARGLRSAELRVQSANG